MKIKNDNGLLINEETRTCLGYLFDFTGHGIFSPGGKVAITKEQAETHNRLLAEAEILGLDQNCQIGQSGVLYLNPRIGITTSTGVKVADYTLSAKQTTVTFERAGKRYRGRLHRDADCFTFKRIA